MISQHFCHTALYGLYLFTYLYQSVSLKCLELPSFIEDALFSIIKLVLMSYQDIYPQYKDFFSPLIAISGSYKSVSYVRLAFLQKSLPVTLVIQTKNHFLNAVNSNFTSHLLQDWSLVFGNMSGYSLQKSFINHCKIYNPIAEILHCKNHSL